MLNIIPATRSLFFAILIVTACRTPDNVSSTKEIARDDSESSRTIRFVHYNIKELTTAKIVNPSDPQTLAAAGVIRQLAPDLLSINEIQYDKPDVPTAGLPGTGKNMERLLTLVDPAQASTWHFTFGEANTGKNAKRLPDGNFAENPNTPASRALADQVNFGTFPGQYSTGFASRFPIKKKIINNRIKWVDWDKSFPFANHKLPNGDPLPIDMSLFDKNFNDSLIDIDGKELHAVTYHTVPAFDFGSGSNTNVLRNKAQLEFLEWYLLGSCEPNNANSPVRQCKRSIRPLQNDAAFIAIGDLNIDYEDTNPGAAVMKRMLTHDRVHNFRAENPDPLFQKDSTSGKSYTTYLSDGLDLGKLQANLDYYIVSKRLEVVASGVSAPLSHFKEHACHSTFNTAKNDLDNLAADADREAIVSTRYLANNQREYCVVSVGKEFAAFRKGSDHFPVFLTFKFGN